MRILVVCTSVSWGGLEQTALRDAWALKKRGFDVELLCFDTGVIFYKAKELGLTIHTIRSQKNYFNVELFFKIRKVVEDNYIDIVHLHTFNTILPILLGLRFFDVKIFATRHIHVEHEKKDFFHRWYLGRLDTLLAISDFERDNLIQMYPLSEDRIKTLYIGINIEAFKRTTEKQEQFRKDFSYVSKDKKIIGIIGRIDPMKGQMEFVESIPNIITKYPQVHFIIVGRPSSENENIYLELVKTRAREIGVDSFITFTGFYEDVSVPLSAMDVFVMPSYFEAFGLISLQAMACGVPVIATSRGSVKEIISDDELGVIIQPRSHNDISEAVIKLLDNDAL
ncbi:MAG: glycosyltransferase family 4 protein, partial [bacterium]